MALQNHSIFVGMDCLLDTRLAALGKYSPEAAEEMLMTGKYHTRKHNCFDRYVAGLDLSAAEEIYNLRDIAILRDAVITPIVLMISDITDRYKVVSGRYPVSTEVNLTVNVHPYKLDKDLTEEFREVLRATTGIDVIKFCNLPLEIMSVEYLSQYETVIWNELDNWMNIHHGDLSSKKMAETVMYCPEIHVDPDKDISDVHPDTPANELRMMLMEYVNFEILPLELFSAVRPT